MDSLGDEVQSGLSRIHSSTGRMQALIEGLLNYTKLDDIRAKKESVDFNEVLEETLEDFSEALAEKQGKVRFDALPVLPAVRLQIQQLFANVLSNSIKYARPGVPLQVTIGSVMVAGNGPRSYEISITDNGIGFSQQYSDKIFEIFQRLDRSTAAGTGIGLAICKKIVENHGGNIRAVSEPDQGTTFYIQLPAAG